MTFRNIKLSASMLILTLLCAAVLFAQESPLNNKAFDDYVTNAMKEWHAPGLAIAVVKDDKIVFTKGYGVKEVGKSDPVTTNTIFAIGSSSKAFTSAAVAILVDEGKVKWGDPATKYLPGFQLYDPWVTRELTVTDLLCHRVGLERGDLLWYGSAYSRDEILRRIRYLKPSSSMRTKFGYQNIMYLAAGQIVPSVTGKSWDDFVAERIFKPLGMTSSSTSVNQLAKFPDVATPHIFHEQTVKTTPWRNIDNIAPAGSINSSVNDMAQWLRMQLGKGKYDGKQVISEASINNMWASHMLMTGEPVLSLFYPDANFTSYGLGWFLSDFKGRKLIEHGGAIDGMRSSVMLMPQEKLGVVILANTNETGFNHALAYRVIDAYLGAPERDWAGDFNKKLKGLQALGEAAQKKRDEERAKNTSPSLSLEKYIGDYQDEMYGDAKVTLEDGKLVVQYGTGFKGVLEHWHYDIFQSTWSQNIQGKGFVQFKLNGMGKVDSLAIEGISEFKRLPDKPAK